MRIGIVGPGRLGRSLAALLRERGHEVSLHGRGARPSGDVILLTVPDAALASAAATVPRGAIVLHCSGAAEVEVLRPHRPAGSLHPLMTFPGPEVGLPDLKGVAAAVSGDPEAVAAAEAIARDLGMHPFAVRGDRRLYHAAAVMAGNFATVLLADATTVLIKSGVEPDDAARLLVPLAIASLRNAIPDPAKALTGPAVRGDRATIEAHRAALQGADLGNLLPVYDLLTRRAQDLASVSSRRSDEDD